MSTALTDQVLAALTAFSSSSRLYALAIGDLEDVSVLVEAFVADDALDGIGIRDVIALSTNAYLKLDELLGQPATLSISLADGTRTRFGGEVCEAAMLGSDGGLARYRIRIASWLWRLAHVRDSRVWQDKSVIEIVDAVFEAYQPQARWRWSEDVAACMARVPPRSYCCQYRESDFDFVRRLLADEGLCWRLEQGADGPGVVLFADSTRVSAVPEDCSSARNGGIRYHAARAVEHQDTVQALVAQRRLHASITTLLSSDYKAKQIVAGSSPSQVRQARNLPPLEFFDMPGQYAFANREQALRHADMHMQAQEARSQLWRGRSTVRTLRAGSRMRVTGMPLQALRDTAFFTVLRVTSIGINNMPASAQQALASLFGPIAALLQATLQACLPDDFAAALAQARDTGYANCFDALPADLVWRPALDSRPTALGSQSAIVVGATGNVHAEGANELYCDRLGRVRIRFHWQVSSASCWVRVAQRAAGGGMGSQFLPRIGQEVLVQFLEHDIDRPIIVGALYNGRGEGGTAPTPGGRRNAASDPSCFTPAHDHARSGQGNLAGGNSPVWHGASADRDGHRNPSAQWGVRSKEFGGTGYNQLLFDDTDAQGRVQLKSTHAASELNLGHLIHAADNYRGSFRGLGAELRTDDYGAVRAAGGLLISSYKINQSAAMRDPAGENAAGVGLLAQAGKLAEALHTAAICHQTVGLAVHAGASKADASALDEQSAPIKAMIASLKGMVDTDGSRVDGELDSSAVQLPHSRDPIIALSAKDGFGATAGQDLQLANGEAILLASGQDSQFATGGQMRWHTGQALGLLGGVVKAGEGGFGVQLVAAKDPVDIQAQADTLKVQARDEVNVVSAHGHIDWAAAKRISLSTAGGANITIEGGNITVQCPGKILIHAGKKSLVGPDSLNYPLQMLPKSEFAKRTMQFNLRLADTPGPNGHSLASTPWVLTYGDKPDGLSFIDDRKILAKGLTDSEGNIFLSDIEQEKLATEYARHPDHTWLVYPGHIVQLNVYVESTEWNAKEKLLHALNAADFSASLHDSNFSDGAMPQTRYAKEAYETAAANLIFSKIKI